MRGRSVRRLLAPIVQLREGESTTALLMFAYSFLAMTAHNIVKPVTRSKFIGDLGADNIPYVQLAAGALIGVAMHGYGALAARLPRGWAIPVTQAGMAALLLAFWALFDAEAAWPSVAFYFLGLVLGILLISQFWTLANELYDARQAKRVFGFIGGGASLGGMVGSGLTSLAVAEVGAENLLLLGAAVLAGCVGLVCLILRRERGGIGRGEADEEGIGGKEALRLLRESKHLQLIALVIGFSAVGAAIIEQQLNMAVEAFKGRDATDEITGFLAQVTFYLSAVGFAVQVGLTSRIHRYLGIGFALLVLPVSLGATGLVMLLNAALWAPALARILDSALRYTVDKTTREILFLPLPAELKQRAKPFVDVTVDRVAKALGALLVLALIQPWGLDLGWQQVSYASLAIMALWMATALRARREYLTVFRASLERHALRADEIRLDLADLSTVEALVEELANPDEERVLHAIELLEALDKRNLVTPLLLHHASPEVRARALGALEAVKPEIAERWLPVIRRMLRDESVAVRVAAAHALTRISRQHAAELLRPYLEDPDPRVAVAAAVSLADSPSEVDRVAETLRRLAGDARPAGATGRREAARGLGRLPDPRFRTLLVPLLSDPDVHVAREAIRSARQAAPDDPAFAPGLVSLLRHRQLKAEAREALVAYGQPVVDTLAHFLRDEQEDPWVRRHIPATLALLPCQASVDALVAALGDADGFVRHKSAASLERLRREHPELALDVRHVEERARWEGRRYLNYLSLLHNLLRGGGVAEGSLLARTLQEKLQRTRDRSYRLLGLVYPATAVAAARRSIEYGDPRSRAGAIEYLDSLLGGTLRKWLMPLIEEAPLEERALRANALLRTRVRDVEDTLAQLVHDEDPAVSAAAILLVERRELWALADDLEHVLAHRDAADLWPFEAASWALAARRMPRERRRELWLEPLPAVELADRLSRVPLFEAASVDELLRIAGMGRQVRHAAGRVLFREGTPAGGVHLLLDGCVSASGAAGTHRTRAPAPLGVAELIQGLPMSATLQVEEASITLAIEGGAFLSLLADNIELAQGLLRMLLDARGGLRSRVVAGRPGGAPLAAALAPIERVRRLRENPLFAGATAEQLLRLAGQARELPLLAGATLFAAGDEPALFLVLSGAVSLDGTAAHGPVVAGPADAIGACEALGGIRADRSASVSRDGRALRVDRDELLEVVEGDVDLLQELLGALLAGPGAGPGGA
jgi:HEAT repeat protein/CRP-like cAMP-binding protein